MFKENLDDEKCNPNSPHFLVDNIPEDNLIAKISINLENGLLIPDNTKKDGRYTFIEIKDMINASQLAYQKAKYKREDYGRNYLVQILSIALDYHNILSEDGKTINLPRFIPFSVRNARVNKEADKVKNMVNWVKECLKNCKQGETLFFPWLAYGHAGMVAINSSEYNKDQLGVYLRYFEMGGMYLCDDGIITDSGNFNGIEKFEDKSRINDCFGEFASHVEGYTENIPVPVCFDIIKNKSGPYGQRASETDCSYRSEAAYIFYINGTIKNFDDFKIILNNEENLKLIKDTIYGVKRRALIRLNDNNRYKNIFYYNAGSGNYTKDLALLPKISIEYNDYKGYPDNPWAQIPQTNSNEQNSQIFGNNFTDAKLKFFSQIQDKNDQLDTITLKLSEDGKKLLKKL